MDFDFWASRAQSSSKYHTAFQAARLSSESHLNLDDFEGDDDIRVSLPCPFCYVDIELPTLCNHLQEEHCFDVKNAVCPICAENLGRDVIGHFRVQHSHLLKRRRKSQRSGLWSSNSTVFGKDLRELSAFHGLTSMKGGGNVPDCAPDPLISPFLCSIAREETKPTINKSTNSDKKRCDAYYSKPCLKCKSVCISHASQLQLDDLSLASNAWNQVHQMELKKWRSKKNSRELSLCSSWWFQPLNYNSCNCKMLKHQEMHKEERERSWFPSNCKLARTKVR